MGHVFPGHMEQGAQCGLLIRTRILALLLPSFRALGKLGKLARPQFLHLKHGATASEVVATPK